MSKELRSESDLEERLTSLKEEYKKEIDTDPATLMSAQVVLSYKRNLEIALMECDEIQTAVKTKRLRPNVQAVKHLFIDQVEKFEGRLKEIRDNEKEDQHVPDQAVLVANQAINRRLDLLFSRVEAMTASGSGSTSGNTSSNQGTSQDELARVNSMLASMQAQLEDMSKQSPLCSTRIQKILPKALSLFSEDQNKSKKPKASNPLLKIAKEVRFDGDYCQYLEFAAFVRENLDADLTLTESEKYRALKGLLDPPAANEIRSVLSKNEYEVAARTLMNRYAKPKAIQGAVESRLERYCNRKAYTANDLLTLRGRIMEAKDSFLALECDVSELKIIRKISVKALDDNTLREYHRRHDDTLDSLIDFLVEEADAREGLERDYHSSSTTEEQRAKRERTTTLAALHPDTGRNRLACYLCDDIGHLASVCIAKLGTEAREILEKRGVCTKCARKHSGECINPFVHWKCKAQHLPCFCPKLTQLTTAVTQRTTDGPTYTILASIVGSSIDNSDETVWLLSFQAKVDSIKPGVIRGMGDGGSGCSVITQLAIKVYGLTKRKARRPRVILDCSNKEAYIAEEVAEITLINLQKPSKRITITCYVIDGDLPALPMPSERLRRRLTEEGIYLSDGQKPHLTRISVLIGADIYYSVFPPTETRPLVDKLYVIHSLLGDVLHGPQANKGDRTSCVRCLAMTSPPALCLCRDLRSLMGGEETPDDKENDLCRKFTTSIRYVPEKARYQAPLPWLDARRATVTRTHAINQTQRLRARLRKQGQLEAYHKEISKYVEAGHAVLLESPPVEAFYLPHFAVVKEEKVSTKVRVVFNGSAVGAEGISLNDTLYKGTPVHADLLSILLKFRVETVVALADMKQAFLQIEIKKEDRDSLCYLWFEHPSDPLPQTFQMRVLPFGLTCSPFVLGTVIERLLDDHGHKFPKAAQVIRSGLYMDDLVIPLSDEDSGKAIIHQIRELLRLGSFELHKFASNSEALRSWLGIDPDDRQASCLGVKWDFIKDVIQIAPPSISLSLNHVPTRRQAIQWMASIFDPLGLLLPWKIQQRALAREIASEGILWDNPISVEAWKRLQRFVRESEKLDQFVVPRYVDMSKNKRAYSDAAVLALGGALYGDNNLLVAKGRLSPRMSIPKLELDASCVAAELIGQVERKLEIPTSDIRCYSDSMVTLGRIHNHPNRYPVFEANRLIRIRRHTDKEQWFHIESKANPADKISRGESLSKLSSSWFCGPEETTETPTRVIPLDTPVMSLPHSPLSSPVTVLSLIQKRIGSATSYIVGMRIAKRVVEFLEKRFRYLSYIKQKKKVDCTLHQYSRLVLFKAVQKVTLSETNMKQLGRRMTGVPPYVDSKGVIRANTRLSAGDLPLDFRAPIVLVDSTIVRSMVEIRHRETGHRNHKALRSLIQEEYYLLKISDICKQVCRNCTVCSRRNRRGYQVPEAPLPSARASPPRKAFDVVGVDFYGPVAQAKVKCYALLFTCGATRAVHLELVHNMSFHDCMNAFVRFTSLWGKPRVVFSDNAKTFTKTGRILTELVRAGRKYCGDHGIEWRFITPYSPWKGGFYERLVGVVKRVFEVHARGLSKLSFEDTRTAVAFVQGLVNSRPLFQDPESGSVVVPNQFLTGENIQLNPDVYSAEVNEDFLPEQFRMRVRLQRWLWQRWRSCYLTTLRRYRSTKEGRQPNLGDLVAISDPRLKWGEWLVGEISELLPGSDRRSRSVVVTLLKGGSRVCSTRHLVHLEFPFRKDAPASCGGEECEEMQSAPKETTR